MTALKYIKSWISSTTHALEDPKSNQAVTMEDKEKMVGRAVFPHSPVDPAGTLPHYSGRVCQKINEVTVWSISFNQS